MTQRTSHVTIDILSMVEEQFIAILPDGDYDLSVSPLNAQRPRRHIVFHFSGMEIRLGIPSYRPCKGKLSIEQAIEGRRDKGPRLYAPIEWTEDSTKNYAKCIAILYMTKRMSEFSQIEKIM